MKNAYPNRDPMRLARNIRQDDIVLVDYGRQGLIKGVHPSLVMNRRKTQNWMAGWIVIPLFRDESYSSEVADALIRQTDCPQLRCDMYAQVDWMQFVLRGRVVGRIGHMNNPSIHKELERNVWERIGGDD
jgi:hypothetical protein